jgi:hypothetical protein
MRLILSIALAGTVLFGGPATAALKKQIGGFMFGGH